MNDILFLILNIFFIVFLIRFLIKEREFEHRFKIHPLNQIVQVDLTLTEDFFLHTKKLVDDILYNTCATRFLLFYGLNKSTDVVAVTTFYEQFYGKQSPGAIYRYRTFEVDDAYRKMLSDAKDVDILKLDVRNMEDCILKRVYLENEAPPIKYSLIKYIGMFDYNEERGVLLYSSIATSDEVGYDDYQIEYISNKMNEISKYMNESLVVQ